MVRRLGCWCGSTSSYVRRVARSSQRTGSVSTSRSRRVKATSGSWTWRVSLRKEEGGRRKEAAGQRPAAGIQHQPAASTSSQPPAAVPPSSFLLPPFSDCPQLLQRPYQDVELLCRREQLRCDAHAVHARGGVVDRDCPDLVALEQRPREIGRSHARDPDV